MDSGTVADVRGPAIQYKRDRDRAAKWALGSWSTRARYCPNRRDGPSRRDQGMSSAMADDNDLDAKGPRYVALPVHVHRKPLQVFSPRTTVKKRGGTVCRSDVEDALYFDDEPVSHLPPPPLQPPGDQSVYYSYDAPSGPASRTHILTQALTQAVERYEGQRIDDLIKHEYEFVVGPSVLDADHRPSSPSSLSTPLNVLPITAISNLIHPTTTSLPPPPQRPDPEDFEIV